MRQEQDHRFFISRNEELGAVATTDPQFPTYVEMLFSVADARAKSGKMTEAEAIYRQIATLDPEEARPHFELGRLLRQQGKHAAAAVAYRNAIAIKPALAAAHFDLGDCLRQMGRLEEAVESYRMAIIHQPGNAEAAYHLGIVLQALGRTDEAVEAYSQATALKPDHAEAHNNLGTSLKALDRLHEAVAALHRAIRINPTYADAFHNLGNVLKLGGEPAKAERAYRHALTIDPMHLKALSALADVLREQGKLEEARGCLERILAVKPDDPLVLATLCFIKEILCDWRDRDAEFARLMEITNRQLAAGERTALTSFCALSRPLSEAQHLAIARSWAQEAERKMAPLRRSLGFSFTRYPRDRLRIGYLSSDFYNHATAHLIQGLFGLHDRDGFEVFVYSYGKDDGSSYRRRIAA
ncbi:tetratricopeptide repeat protein, partial [Rhodospirillaceae bacterium SYSU D60014]|uniref:tetratricopeptide repeat protein n=1 Tax=Virgifigura deserti TaxID=2268457 RepID=UPI000E65F0BC